ncbi:RNA-guided endonuclease InsQ/TnpB family protein [Natronoarchaeum mannanilyticum]|uniref:RNA-guided endonuclease TnpB family protein n=1 Tax=Natronoarchaeum mannanilyticum TaxID=926360 RepID=A0AAV3T9V4_9EURY
MAGPDYLRRTAITRLSVSEREADLLEETIVEWQRGANIATSVGWTNSVTDKRRLQSLCYDDIRDQTDLGSQHTILACFQAAEALKGIHTRKQEGREYSMPEFTSPTVTYDAKTMTLFDDGTVSLATTASRIRCELVLPEDEEGYQYQYLDSEEWQITESTLTARDGEYYLHLGFRKHSSESETDTAEDRTVLGVDLGIENLAVTSTAHFESGRQLLHEHREYEKVRKGLQRTGTESARRTIVRRGDREKRHNRDYLHRVSNRILREASKYDCTHIVFEDLTYIRDAMASSPRFQQWAHRQLVRYVSYKAEEQGIEVEFVDPQNTSRRCCDCGYTSQNNRVNREVFECKSCGSTANADYNAAKNIGWKFVRCGQQHSQRTGDSQLALKSGTVKPNRGFAPYPSVDSGVEAENTDKPAS